LLGQGGIGAANSCLEAQQLGASRLQLAFLLLPHNPQLVKVHGMQRAARLFLVPELLIDTLSLLAHGGGLEPQLVHHHVALLSNAERCGRATANPLQLQPLALGFTF
jgi:hypothetical protein